MKYLVLIPITILIFIFGCSETDESGNLIDPYATTYPGDIVITDGQSWPVTAYNRLETIEGNLTFQAASDGSYSFESLITINGNLLIENNSISTIDYFANLEIINGNFTIQNNYLLNTINIPNLETVSGNFTIINNLSLPQSEADDLYNQLVGFTGTANYQTGNVDNKK